MSVNNFKPTLLVLAPYPNKDNLNDGFIQRVNKMDEFMEGIKRVYLHVSIRSFLKKEEVIVDEDVIFIKLNLILHFFTIMKFATKVKLIYAHTIYNLRWVSYFFDKIKCPIILDVHGTVPEEKLMNGQVAKSKFFDKIESKCFEKISTAIFVTESMHQHFVHKYPKAAYRAVKYGIIPGHLTKENLIVDEDIKKDLRDKLNIKPDDVVVIYSGGLHVWQNIDLMLTEIGKKKNDENIVYIFLVSNKIEMKNKIENLSLGEKRIILDSVDPSELKLYYSISNYGFVLREDDVVNRVANPTKLIEYLSYNIIPIVKLIDIGDFNKFGYEYLSLENFHKKRLEKTKSLKNSNIVHKIFDSYNQDSIRQIFLPFK